MRPGRRRVLVAIAVLLPALLVYGARRVGAPAVADDLPATAAPVFVGRVTPEHSHWSVGRPLRVTVEIRADRPLELAGLRVGAGDGRSTELAPFAVGPQPRTVPLEVTFPSRRDYPLVLQVRLEANGPWESLPPDTRVIVA